MTSGRVLRNGKTQAQVAGDAWLDESYVSRLLSGERDNPSGDALLLLASWGLGLAVEETDELLVAADYKPLILAYGVALSSRWYRPVLGGLHHGYEWLAA